MKIESDYKHITSNKQQYMDELSAYIARVKGRQNSYKSFLNNFTLFPSYGYREEERTVLRTAKQIIKSKLELGDLICKNLCGLHSRLNKQKDPYYNVLDLRQVLKSRDEYSNLIREVEVIKKLMAQEK